MAKRYPGHKFWYVTPDLSKVAETFRTMMACEGFMKQVKRSCLQFPMRFEMLNGSEIGFRSCDKGERLEGRGLKGVAFDEASKATEKIWFKVLKPMLADCRGEALLASTFNGKNWYYDLSQKGLDARRQNSIKTWIYPTRTGLRFKSKAGLAELASIKDETPLPLWLQEYECEPLAAVDQAFKFVDGCIRGRKIDRPLPGRRYILAVDIGGVQDPAAVVIMDAQDGQVVYWEQFPLGSKHATQAERCRQLAILFRVICSVIDVTGGGAGGHSDPVVPEYASRLPGAHQITWTPSWKYKAVHWLDKMMQDSKVGIPSEPADLIHQVKDYRFYPSAKSDICHYSAPKGGHDDLMACLLMAAWAMNPKVNWAAGASVSLAPG
jgi:hypothetical protein